MDANAAECIIIIINPTRLGTKGSNRLRITGNSNTSRPEEARRLSVGRALRMT